MYNELKKAYSKKLQDKSKKQVLFDISNNVNVFFEEEIINNEEFDIRLMLEHWLFQ
ncbi:26855_t:CDS:1, partial [Dentiscutata erythropus]